MFASCTLCSSYYARARCEASLASAGHLRPRSLRACTHPRVRACGRVRHGLCSVPQWSCGLSDSVRQCKQAARSDLRRTLLASSHADGTTIGSVLRAVHTSQMRSGKRAVPDALNAAHRRSMSKNRSLRVEWSAPCRCAAAGNWSVRNGVKASSSAAVPIKCACSPLRRACIHTASCATAACSCLPVARRLLPRGCSVTWW